MEHYNTQRRDGIHQYCRILALVIAIVGMTLPKASIAQQVYIGSGNGWKSLITHPDQWTYVRQNADGFYINFIELLKPDPTIMGQLSSLFTHKNAYYESDSRYTGLGGFPDGGQFSRALQMQEMNALLQGGFSVPYTSLNYGLDTDKQTDLKHQGLPAGQTRPCFTQCGPWTFGGDINGSSASAVKVREMISHSDGVSTDGPLSLWQADQGHMQSGSFSVVKYVHSLHKTAIVMVAPYNLKPISQWLSVAQQCVRQHEDAGARPDIWVVFEYATNTPTLPETENGQPANTISGMAYWLIHHLKDPKHWARISGPTSGDAKTQNVTLRNDSAWMDLCPVLTAKISDPHHAWRVRFHVNGQDVTRQMTNPNGLPFIGNLRLWPGDKRQIQVTMVPKNSAASSAGKMPSVQISLQPSVSAKSLVSQRVTLHPFGLLASR